MGWDTLLVMYAPFLLGLAAFALIALAVWLRPPRWVRVSAGGWAPPFCCGPCGRMYFVPCSPP
ncbi:hypothetical protein M5E87_27450 [Flavonifractor plautii]|nr:hypothetical protein M5E87_27450 [Flavonifractor plautii]